MSITGESAQAGSLLADQATVAVSAGSLTLSDATNDSTIGQLQIDGGTVGGAGSIDITNQLSWTAGTMSGPGTTTIMTGATGAIAPAAPDYQVTLDGRQLQINGTVSVSCDDTNQGTISGANGAAIQNDGTLTVGNGDPTEQCNFLQQAGSAADTVTNTGTFDANAPTVEMNWEFANGSQGTVSGDSGALALTGGPVPGATEAGTWSVLELYFLGGSYDLAPDISMSSEIVVAGSWASWAALGVEALQGVQPSPAEATLSTSAMPWPSTALVLAGDAKVNLSDSSGQSQLWLLGLAPNTEFSQPGQLALNQGLLGAFSPDLQADEHHQGVIDGTGTTSAPVIEPPLRIDQQTVTTTNLLLSTFYAFPDDASSLSDVVPITLTGGKGATINNYGTALASGLVIDGLAPGGLLYDGADPRPTFNNEAGASLSCGGWFDSPWGGGYGPSEVDWNTYNWGTIDPQDCQFGGAFVDYNSPGPSEMNGPHNPAEPNVPRLHCGDPVDCGTGNLYEQQTDLSVGGLGPGLSWVRTYNSQLAASQSTPGAMGYGWTTSYSDALVIDPATGNATVDQADGSTVPFTAAAGGGFSAPARVQATLAQNSDGTYTYTLPDRTTDTFDANGRLVAQSDRNGNQTTLTYDDQGRLASVSDPAGRELTFDYNADGLLASVTDPSGLTVSYSYDSAGNLVAVQDSSGISQHRWQFGYDGHELTSMTDADGNTVTNSYDSSQRVISQTDPDGQTRTWDYAQLTGGETATTITAPAGDQTYELFQSGVPIEIIHGYGTTAAQTTSITYNAAYAPANVTDGNGNVADYYYDSNGNLAGKWEPDGNLSWWWAYDGHHDLTTAVTPSGEETDYSYDANGNLTGVSRWNPWQGPRTQTWTYAYNSRGERTSATDPLGNTSTYGYDSQGDLTSQTDPAGNQTTWTYDIDSRESSQTPPRGNASGADPSRYTTTITRDALGLPTTVSGPLGQTRYEYDPDGRTTKVTDPNGDSTTYAYDGDGLLTTVTAPDGSTQSNTYDADGRLTGQTNGAGKTTTYSYDAAGDEASTTDPLGRTTSYGYDPAGNRISMTDPAGRETSYAYNAQNQLTGVIYSDASTPNVSYTYNPDGQPSSMTDGTGTTTYTYDSLDELLSQTDGSGNQVSYTYDLDGNITAITYPNGHTVNRSFNNLGELQSATDWLGNTTSFSYDPDSNLQSTTYPTATGNVDNYGYNTADQLTSIHMTQGQSTLASLAYTRDPLGLVTDTTQTGLPGAASTDYTYTPTDQVASAGSTNYGYDNADNITQLDGTTGYSYDQANQLTSSPSTTYGYDQLGDRTSATPTGETTNDYAYNQAGELTSYTPSSGPATTYAYNGDGLRTSETTGSATESFTWQATPGLPMLLADGQNSYIYGPDNLAIEQINNTGTPTYLHHDEIGSTRLITNSGGNSVGAATYTTYGAPSGSSGTASTPLGYAGQYTDPETGLINMRARWYDPDTGQFLTRDPLEAITGQPYSYANDDPINNTDPSGLFCIPFAGCGFSLGFHPVAGLEGAANFAAGLANAVVGTASFGNLSVPRPFCGGLLGFSYADGQLTAGAEAGVAIGPEAEFRLAAGGAGPIWAPIGAGQLSGLGGTYVGGAGHASGSQLFWGAAAGGSAGGVAGNVAGATVYAPSRAAVSSLAGLAASTVVSPPRSGGGSSCGCS